MSDPENFLGRWSRRKREAPHESAPAKPQDAATTAPPADADAKKVPFDPASLPPIESIAAATDISAFLKPGVPAELRRAALRRVWSADPAIRDFVGLVESGWDFNNPDAMPGFGPILAGDVANLLARMIGAPQPADPAAQRSAPLNDPRKAATVELAQQLPEAQAAPAQCAVAEESSVQRDDDIATQNNSDEKSSLPRARRRGHGGALPK
jgi:hypothetical protein